MLRKHKNLLLGTRNADKVKRVMYMYMYYIVFKNMYTTMCLKLCKYIK